MSGELSNNNRMQRVSAAVAAGQTPVVSDSVDLLSDIGVVFIIQLGAIIATGVATVKAEISQDDTNWDDVAGSEVLGTTGDDDKVIVLDLDNVAARYARVTITRTIADSAIDSIMAINSGASIKPVAHDASLIKPVFIGYPIIGTP